jgi:aminopeptidase N
MAASARLLRSPASVVAMALVLAFTLATSVAAAGGYSFDTTPGRLPKTVVPIHYAIELEPDLEKLTVAGTEMIDIEVRSPTTELVLNAVAMTLAAASTDNETQRASIALDAQAETATLTFAQPLGPGTHRLRIDFKSEIVKFGRGLFAVDYPTDKGSKRMLASHLEPTDARRIFPCWDEPAFKASFQLTVTVPRTFLAVSNMPVEREEPVTPTLKQVSFAPTPKMSTYLVVLAAGELERLTAQSDGVTVGVVTTMGKREQGRFALDNAVNLLRYFNDYFGVKYALPKLDLIAVPGGFGGAMENWGGIIFFESRLLFDPANNAGSARRGIFSVLAHEMAHQWFGDLVTMAWWNDIWLNEGFASWMEAKAAEHFYPQWRTWLNNNGRKQFAMEIDTRRTAHAIQHPVANETEAMAAFDGITYSKGQALIRMLEAYLGDDTFRDGIRRYLAAHAYGSTTTADLWQALEGAAGKPVMAIAATFTEQAGVPLVIAEASCSGDEQRIRLRQERFTAASAAAASEGATALETPQHWLIPITVGPLRARGAAQTVLLDTPSEIVAGHCGEPIKLNLRDIGYYRVEYDSQTRAALARSMELMPPADRLNLLADSWALVTAGRAGPPAYLELVEQLGGDDNRAVWGQVTGVLTRLDWLARGRSERDALQAYARGKLRPLLDRLGWDAAGRTNEDGAQLRTRVIQVLGDLGDADVLAEAKRRFSAYLADPQTLPPALRGTVIHLAGLTADRATYDTLIALARKTTITNERSRYYSAAAAARDPALARATLELTLTDELPSTLVSSLINTVAGAGEQPELAWEFVRANYDKLAAKQGPSFRNAFVANLMTNFTDAARADELASFAPAHATSGGERIAARSEEMIRTAAELKARALPAVDAWLKARNAAPN